jgi:hypothetical protein
VCAQFSFVLERDMRGRAEPTALLSIGVQICQCAVTVIPEAIEHAGQVGRDDQIPVLVQQVVDFAFGIALGFGS